MKKLLIYFIKLYQKIPFNSHTMCKFQPTCSNYAIIAINEYGSIKGTYLSIKRILRCNPFNKKSGFDPVPIKEKKMKKIKFFILGILSLVLFSGCDFFKVDTMENIDIITTSYPLEFVLKTLYGEHALIKSIFPDGIDITTYEISEKLLDSYSKEDLFVYVSFGDDKDIAVELLERNKKLLLIDGSLGMSPDYIEELWLNPSNLLMVAQNIKDGLIEYISNSYLIKEIESNYEKLKLSLSELDAEIKLTAENATSKIIVTGNKSLNYLEKYGFEVISLDDDNASLDKTIKEVSDMAEVGLIKYVYTLENSKENETVKTILTNNSSLKEIKLRKIDNITDDERNNSDDYFKLMHYNLEQLKKETYK